MEFEHKQLVDTLRQYSTDVVMLDGFWQWSSNPTSYSAGYALAQNYDYIKADPANFRIRLRRPPNEETHYY